MKPFTNDWIHLPLPLSLTVLGLGEDGHIASLFPGMNPDLAFNSSLRCGRTTDCAIAAD
jgi:6-phosphogluconolactonase/glucosamine-6-phosphate isomerase/deaminase